MGPGRGHGSRPSREFLTPGIQGKARPSTQNPVMSVSTLACGNCRQPMQRLALQGHYGRSVDLDLCAPCHLLWFDSLEGSRLTGRSMLSLLGSMADAHAQPHHALRPAAACPHCSAGLKPVVNRSRFGQAEQLECRAGHGTWSSFGQWLAERGLVRPLTAADRVAFAARQGIDWNCINCGAPMAEANGSACSFCGSLAGVFDIARMARALDPDGATESMSIHRSERAGHTFTCHACGHSGSGMAGTGCPQCGATLISTDLKAVHQRLSELSAPLAAHERSAAPHVRERRLKALEADLGRRRETVRDLERSARGESFGLPEDGDRRGGRLDDWLAEVNPLARAAFWLVALLVGLWLSGAFGG